MRGADQRLRIFIRVPLWQCAGPLAGCRPSRFPVRTFVFLRAANGSSSPRRVVAGPGGASRGAMEFARLPSIRGPVSRLRLEG